MIRNANASIIIHDVWDGIDQDSELFIKEGRIYKKLEIYEILELSVLSCIVKIKPNANKEIKFTIKSDGIQNPDYKVVFENTYEALCTNIGEMITYTFDNSSEQLVFFTGRIGFELDPTCSLVDVIQWGDNNSFCYFSKFFKNCLSKSISAFDQPDLKYVTSLYQTFYNSNVSLNFNAIDTSTIIDLTQAYYGSLLPNLNFVYPTFENVSHLDQTFSYITQGSITWDGVKFKGLMSSLNTFQGSVLNGYIINSEFGNTDQTGLNNKPIYTASSLFKDFKLSGSMSNNSINSSYINSLFENSELDQLIIDSFIFKSILNCNNMFYSIKIDELLINNINNNFVFLNGCLSQQMFSNIEVKTFKLSNINFGQNQLCLNMFSNMIYNSAEISNINFNNASLDYIFRDVIYSNSIKNIKVSNWNTSLCTTAISMFENNDNILIQNPNIVNINLENVVNTSSMYKGCKLFDFKSISPISTTFKNVENASSMFEGCTNASPNLVNARFPKLKYANRMFKNCSNFNSDLSNSNMVLLEQADYMFENCSVYNSGTIYSQNLQSAIGILKNCSSFNQNINFDFNHNYVIQAKELFMGCVKLNPTAQIDLDLSSAIDLTSLFEDCKELNQNIVLDTSNCQIFEKMFKGTSISNLYSLTLNTQNALTMKYMFAYTFNFGADLSSFNTYNNLDLSGLCYRSSNFSSDLSFIETDNVLNMQYLFGTSSCNNVTLSSMTNWNVSKVTNFTSCFEDSDFNCSLNWATNDALLMKNMFRNNKIFNSSLPNLNVSKVTSAENMFLNCLSYNQDISGLRFNNCTTFDFMLYNCPSFVNKNLSQWLINSTKTNILHNGFLKTPHTNTEPIWK